MVLEYAALGSLNTYLLQTKQTLYANMTDGISDTDLVDLSRQCVAGALAVSHLKVNIK